jgi:hypothetical protein
MTKNFTTPAFAKVLKEHGIEIDTPYTHQDGNVYAYCLFQGYYEMVNVTVDHTKATKNLHVYAAKHEIVILPAYPLTEVLGWLPKTLIEHLKPTNTPSHRPDYLSYPITSDIDDNNVLKIGYKSEYYGTKITPMPIEALITQGLTEGWLTKDNLNLAK